MKTVSTKLENRIHDKFLELCNEQGKCQSELLRDLIKELCEPLDEGNRPATLQDLDVELPLKPTVQLLMFDFCIGKLTRLIYTITNPV